MPLQDLVTPPVRLRLQVSIDRLTERFAIRAAFAAAHLFGLAAGIALRQLRAMGDPLANALATAKEAELKAVVSAQALELLGARFDRLPERRRPFYTPEQRFRILELASLLGWPAEQTARAFRVCTQTIRNWRKAADPHARSVGPRVHPTPPVTRFADVVRNTVHLMARAGFGGDAMTAAVLARAGYRVSKRSVCRIRKERRREPSPPTPPHTPSRPVIARFVNHVCMMDVTEVPAFLGGTFFLAAVFDAYSRVPLALQAFDAKPGASAMARLLKRAASAFGPARYLITDKVVSSEAVSFSRPRTDSRSDIATAPPTGSSPPHGSRGSGGRSRSSDDSSSRLPSRSQTSSSASNPRSTTTSTSVRTRASVARRPPKPSSGSSPPVGLQPRRREDNRAKGLPARRSRSDSSPPTPGPSRS